MYIFLNSYYSRWKNQQGVYVKSNKIPLTLYVTWATRDFFVCKYYVLSDKLWTYFHLPNIRVCLILIFYSLLFTFLLNVDEEYLYNFTRPMPLTKKIVVSATLSSDNKWQYPAPDFFYGELDVLYFYFKSIV